MEQKTSKALGSEFNPFDEPLTVAVENAELILSHASERGLHIDKNHIRIIVEAKDHEKNDSWTNENAIEFWSAYRFISKIIQPVNINGLRAAQYLPVIRPNLLQKLLKIKMKSSMARRAVKNYTMTSIIAALLMLVVQFYSLKGTTLLNNIQLGTEKMKEYEIQFNSLGLVSDNNPQDRSASSEKYRVESYYTEVSNQVESSTLLLKSWLEYSNFLTFRKRTYIKETLKADTVAFDPINPDLKMRNNTMIIQESKNFTLILGLYILPLLYGLLGGFVYVLRNLTEDARTLTFSRESHIKYTLRIHLGALAGLVVGLFWGDNNNESISVVENLSPLALAFIAGYSVEFLFNIMDNMISNFTQRKEKAEIENAKTDTEVIG